MTEALLKFIEEQLLIQANKSKKDPNETVSYRDGYNMGRLDCLLQLKHFILIH